MVRVLAKILNKPRGTEETGAAWSAVEPEHNIVSGWVALGGDEDVMRVDERFGLKSQIAAVHLELA